MKRLTLAASIALAVSLTGVGPAAANSLDATTALTTQEDAQPPAGSENAADGTDAKTDHAGGGDDQGQGRKESTESADPTAPGDETPDPDGREDDANEDSDDVNDGAANGATDDAEESEESEPIDASFSLESTEMTAEEIGDPDKGIRYTIDSLKAGDVVTAAPGEDVSTTVESDGAFTGTILGNTELKPGDTLDVTVTVEREGQKSKTFRGSVEVLEPDEENQDSDLTVSPKSQKLDDFMIDGVRLTLVNCVMDEDVKFRITRKGDPDTAIWEDTQKAGEDAAGFTTFIPGTGGDAWIGDFVVTASCGDESAETTFTVTENDDGDGSNSDLTVSPKNQGLQEFFKDGVNITFVNCVMDEEVTFRVSTKHDPDTAIWEETQRAGEDAAGSADFVPEGDGGAGWVGDYLVMVSCGDRSAEATFSVTDDDGVVDPKLSIDPQTLSGEDFVDRNKGVTMTVTGCEPGSDVRFEVWGHEPSEELYNKTVEANENGAGSVQVYGIENSPDAYVGTYKVVAVCLDQRLNGEFVVTASGDGGGSDDSGDSGNAGSMPRTGAELTGLGAGAVLILGGAATILFARRRALTGQ